MFNILLFILYSIIILILIHLVSFTYTKYRRSLRPPITLINKNDKIESIEYSERIMKFTKNLIEEISVIRFREYVDHTDITKVSKKNYQLVASEAAKEIYNKINLNNILFEYTLFTREYYQEFIINYTIHVNKLLVLDYYNKQTGGN